MPQAVIPAVIGLGATAAGSVIASKERGKAEDLANSRQQEALAEQKRLEEKYGLTPGELERQDRVFDLERSQQEALKARAGKTGEQLIRDQGPISSSLLDQIASGQGLTGQQLFEREGDVNKQYVQDVTNFDQTFAQQELGALFDEIVKQTNRRGVLGPAQQGSITLENLGRAGVDFAVQQAKERLAQRASLSEAFINLAQNQNAAAGNVANTALNESGLARQELNNFLSNIQNLDQASKGRAANVALNASNTAQGTINQFASVPIDFAAQGYGQGVQLRNSGINALGQLAGGGFSIGNTGQPGASSTRPDTSFLDQFSKEQRDPLYGAIARAGGLGL